jgi:cold-inducible RNA-binding protein
MRILAVDCFCICTFTFYKFFKMKLFVAGVPYDFDDVDLKEMFELYGEVISAKVVMDRETGKSRGFGFVDMQEDADAKIAIETLDGASIKGKKMAVKQAEEQQRGGGGSGGGGYRGGSGGGGGYRGGSGGGGRDNRDNRGGDNRDNRPPRRY